MGAAEHSTFRLLYGHYGPGSREVPCGVHAQSDYEGPSELDRLGEDAPKPVNGVLGVRDVAA